MIEQILLSIATMAAFVTMAVPFVTEFFFEKVYAPVSKGLKSLFTFLISIVLTFGVWALGQWFDIGFLVDVEKAWHVLIYGIGAGFGASYTWVNIDFIKGVIRLIIAGDTSIFDPVEPKPTMPIEPLVKKK